MVTGADEEQKGKGEELNSQTSDDELEGKDKASTPETTASKEAPTKPVKDEADIERLIETKAQSLKDKELKPIYEERNNLKSENSKLKRDIARKREDIETDIMEKFEREAWAEAPEKHVAAFQTARKELTEKQRKVEDKEAEIQEASEKLDNIEREQQAKSKAIEYLLAEKGKDFISEVDSLVTDLLQCQTPKEMDLTLRVRGGKQNVPTKQETPGKERMSRTDSATNLTAGAVTDFKTIRDAYIANPNDPNIRRQYLEARRKKGLSN